MQSVCLRRSVNQDHPLYPRLNHHCGKERLATVVWADEASASLAIWLERIMANSRL